AGPGSTQTGSGSPVPGMAPTAHDSSQIPQPPAGQPGGAAARPGPGRRAPGPAAGPGSWRHGPGLLASAVTFGRVTAVCPDVVWLAARRLQAHKPAPSRELGPVRRWLTISETSAAITSYAIRATAGQRPAAGQVDEGRRAGDRDCPLRRPPGGGPPPAPRRSAARG